MKKIFSVTCLFIFFVQISLLAQQPNCKIFRNGTFKTTVPGFGTATITRDGKTQTEVSDKGVKMVFDVYWISDCIYTLKPQKVYSEKYKFPVDALLTVTITKTTKTSYFQSSTSNFSNKTLSSEMIKIK